MKDNTWRLVLSRDDLDPDKPRTIELGDISAGVMGNMTMLTGEKLGLFARSGQLSLKSGEGPVEIQAQNGNARLFAEQKLTVSSADDMLFAGKKRITLNGGGSYLKIEAGKIEYGTPSQYLRKVKRTATTAANTLPLPFRDKGLCLRCLMEAAMNGTPIALRGN